MRGRCGASGYPLISVTYPADAALPPNDAPRNCRLCCRRAWRCIASHRIACDYPVHPIQVIRPSRDTRLALRLSLHCKLNCVRRFIHFCQPSLASPYLIQRLSPLGLVVFAVFGLGMTETQPVSGFPCKLARILPSTISRLSSLGPARSTAPLSYRFRPRSRSEQRSNLPLGVVRRLGHETQLKDRAIPDILQTIARRATSL